MFAGKRLLLAVLVSVTTLLGGVTPALASAPPELCSGTHQGDARFGPDHLPRPWQQPVGPILAGYHRFGGLSPQKFLEKYWDATANSWKYPPQDGFRLGPDNQPIKWVSELRVGRKLDRFGSEFGAFLAPAGSPYSSRAIPPQSLNTFDPAYRCNYHAYRVTKSFKVWEGPIAPWFQQPGNGVQEKLDRALVPGDGALNVGWLITNGYLARVS
ncbi:DUF4237 domain-containing protein [Lentzea tibetensis]|uniref:DUF4237 domain-containing protein n=1 Tax=Lentzea tibetensis TaxID=2591470 RepID=A0A563EFJ9_9PSEU|nr:TNT domain-containing protein [Lentzea tibetensis]TWP44756.1 DUF4237 domain-containing protein [Lentzea tibetensis]